MDLNTLKKQLYDQQQKVINDTARATGFSDELKKAIEGNDATYKPFENDVNQSRNTYYNTTGAMLPQITSKQQYSNDPMLALQALENERTIGGTRYQNAQDSLQRRKGSITDLIDSFNKTGQTELQRQTSLADLLGQQYQQAFQEDQARKAAKAQADYLKGLSGGGGNGVANGFNTNGLKVGDVVEGKKVIGFNADGTPVFEEAGKGAPAANDWVKDLGQAVDPSSAGWQDIFNNPKAALQSAGRQINQIAPIYGVGQGLNYLSNFFK